jgi:predicted adenylyl cyclase CyaB
MPIEIEKKYRLTPSQRRLIEKRLRELDVVPGEVEFEENTIYRGGRLDLGGCALRLRRVNGHAILTFKQRFPSQSAIKRQQELETGVADPEAAHAIVTALGFRVGLIYEKRRVLWVVGKAKVVLDELPFGLFMEIEASEKEIKRVEKLLSAETLPPVMETYPSLTIRLGRQQKGIFEARFKTGTRRSPKAKRSKPTR